MRSDENTIIQPDLIPNDIDKAGRLYAYMHGVRAAIGMAKPEGGARVNSALRSELEKASAALSTNV